MVEFLTDCFQGPALIASTLVLCVMAYWAMVTLGAIGPDALDFDLDLPDGDGAPIDVDLDGGQHSPLSIGMLGLKWFNLGEVPLMAWMTIFAISTWALTMLIDRDFRGDGLEGFKVLARNGGISLFVAKLGTQPLKGLFGMSEISGSRDLLGRTCTVTTSTVTEKSGQASCATEAAPLVINVRTDDPQYVAVKGETVRIVDYEPGDNTFIVQRDS